MDEKERKDKDNMSRIEKEIEKADILYFFDMKTEEYKELTDGKLPDNYETMRKTTIDRDIARLENYLATSEIKSFREIVKEKLAQLARLQTQESEKG